MPIALITVTAPGADVLPWACAPGDHPGPCSGPRGCRVEEPARSFWNWTAGARRKRLHRALSGRARRRGMKRWLVGYVWEPQQRGVGHLHLVVFLHTVPFIVAALRELGPRYGFGFVDDARSRPRGGGSEKVTSYITGYLNGSPKLEAVAAAVTAYELPSRCWYLAAWVTRGTGVTMRALRRVRRWWAAANGFLPPAADTGCGRLWGMLAGSPPKAGGRRAPPSAVSEADRLWRVLGYSRRPQAFAT
ncbi:MAG: hypothetical protein WEE36_08720 [Acidimicrobiia bacterium]